MREIRDVMIESQAELIEEHRKLIIKQSSLLVDKEMLKNALQTIADFPFDFGGDRDENTIKQLARTVLGVVE